MSDPLYCLFFSFKGGVGRTSALMNTARSLAKRKKRVLVLDLDLAAPGIDIFDVVYQDGNIDRFSWPSYNPVKFHAYNEKLDALNSEAERKVKATELEAQLADEYANKLRADYGQGAPLGFVEFALKFCDQRFGSEFNPNKAYSEGQKLNVKLEYPSELSDDDEWGKQRYLFKLPTRNTDDGDILVMRAGNYDSGKLNLATTGANGEPHQQSYLIGSYDDRQNRLDVRALAYPYDLDTGQLIEDKLKSSGTENQTESSTHSGSEGKNSATRKTPNPEDEERLKDTAQPEFIQHLKAQIAKLDVDYVLIDGRPGRDNISTLALDWLCSAVVLVFNFNPWNLLGVQQIYKYLHGTDDNPKFKNIRKHAPTTMLLATPIPSFAQNSYLYSGQHKRIQEEMSAAVNNGAEGKRRLVEIPYADQLLLRDVLITDFAPDDVACARYNELASLIIEQNQGDIANQIRAARDATGTQAQKTAFNNVINDNPGSVELLYEYGKFLLEHGDIDDAIYQLNRALDACEEMKAAKGNDAFERVIHVALNHSLQSKYQKLRTLLNKGRSASDFKEFTVLLNNLNQRMRRTEAFIQASGAEEYEQTPSGARLLWQTGGQAMSIAKGIQFLTRLQRYIPGKETDSPQKNSTGLFSKSVREWLEMAKLDFEKSASVLPKNADMEQDQGELNWLLAMTSDKLDENTYQSAIENYKEAVKLKAESGEARLELGRYVLSRAIQANGVAAPLAEQSLPYFVWPEGTNSTNWLRLQKGSEGLVLDSVQIQEAKALFDRAGRQLSNDFFLPFHRGIASFAEYLQLKNEEPKDPSDETEIRGRKAKIIQAVRRGIDGFYGSNIMRPQYSPAYLYSALLEFELARLIGEDEHASLDRKAEMRIRIRERRAFYRIEHFIDLELEHILNQACSDDFQSMRLASNDLLLNFRELDTMPRREERKPFFFDGEEIDGLLDKKFPMKRFEFLSLLEMLTGMLPLSEMLYPNLKAQDFSDHVSLMAAHHTADET